MNKMENIWRDLPKEIKRDAYKIALKLNHRWAMEIKPKKVLSLSLSEIEEISFKSVKTLLKYNIPLCVPHPEVSEGVDFNGHYVSYEHTTGTGRLYISLRYYPESSDIIYFIRVSRPNGDYFEIVHNLLFPEKSFHLGVIKIFLPRHLQAVKDILRTLGISEDVFPIVRGDIIYAGENLPAIISDEGDSLEYEVVYENRQLGLYSLKIKGYKYKKGYDWSEGNQEFLKFKSKIYRVEYR